MTLQNASAQRDRRQSHFWADGMVRKPNDRAGEGGFEICDASK